MPSRIRKLPPDPPVRGFPGIWKHPLLTTPFPGRVSVPNFIVSLFIFYILSYLLSKTMGCFSGRLMSSASGQKLFCEVCSAFRCSFDEFVGEKVVSPSYSSAIFSVFPDWDISHRLTDSTENQKVTFSLSVLREMVPGPAPTSTPETHTHKDTKICGCLNPLRKNGILFAYNPCNSPLYFNSSPDYW